jgi:hypothetical protein
MHPLHAPVATTLNPCLSSPRPRLASGAEVSCGPEGVIGPAYQNAPVRENARQRHSAWRSEQKCFDLFCPLLLSKSTFAMPYCGSQRDSHVSVLIQPQTIDEGGGTGNLPAQHTLLTRSDSLSLSIAGPRARPGQEKLGLRTGRADTGQVQYKCGKGHDGGYIASRILSSTSLSIGRGRPPRLSDCAVMCFTPAAFALSRHPITSCKSTLCKHKTCLQSLNCECLRLPAVAKERWPKECHQHRMSRTYVALRFIVVLLFPSCPAVQTKR